MKKLFHRVPRALQLGVLFGLGVLIIGMGFAYTYETGDLLTAEDYNAMTEKSSAINNVGGDIGIGMEPIAGIKLSVDGLIRTRPMEGVECDSGMQGGIYFKTSDSRFYTCLGSQWAALDNDFCTSNGCEEFTCTIDICDNGCRTDAPGEQVGGECSTSPILCNEECWSGYTNETYPTCAELALAPTSEIPSYMTYPPGNDCIVHNSAGKCDGYGICYKIGHYPPVSACQYCIETNQCPMDFTCTGTPQRCELTDESTQCAQ